MHISCRVSKGCLWLLLTEEEDWNRIVNTTVHADSVNISQTFIAPSKGCKTTMRPPTLYFCQKSDATTDTDTEEITDCNMAWLYLSSLKQETLEPKLSLIHI